MKRADARILVVDDDKNLLDLLIDTLNAIGYDPVGVTNGLEALEKLRTEPFDLIVSDIKMPELDGLGLLEKVRESYPDLPVLFITGVDAPEVIGKSQPNGLLAKPFRVSHIEQLISDALGNRQKSRPANARKVMIVDDDDNFRNTLQDALELNEFSSFGVAAADEALAQLEMGSFDAVVSDIRMPGDDGFKLLKKIKKTYPKLPVVLMTAYLSEEDIRDTLPTSGADGFLEKPFDIVQIVAMLNNLSD
ncbi:MAG: response regulator [bacterium]|nr:response regulator [bacterium]